MLLTLSTQRILEVGNKCKNSQSLKTEQLKMRHQAYLTNLALLKSFSPQHLWKHFAMLTTIPRNSGEEGQIADFIVGIAKHHNCEVVTRDKYNNVLIRVPATEGWEHQKIRCLQSHIDMVCMCDGDIKDMFPLKLRFNNDGNLCATDTTLGADNGIGVAAMLALITDKNAIHGPLELLFTAIEETGLHGAENFDYSLLKSREVFNLDSEHWGDVIVGCAGGGVVRGEFKPVYENHPQITNRYKITVSGLLGGHSGLAIGEGRANAIKVLTKFIFHLGKKVRLLSINGGEKMNAIPEIASAGIVMNDDYVDTFLEHFAHVAHQFCQEFPDEKKMKIVYEKIEHTNDLLMNKESNDSLLDLLWSLPHGVLATEGDSNDSVCTSANLALVNTDKDGDIKITVSVRSSLPEDIVETSNKVSDFLLQFGADAEIEPGFAPWKPQFDTPLLRRVVNDYDQMFGSKPRVATMHAGLECSAAYKKMKDVSIVSFGPSIGDAHKKTEWVNVESVSKFWDFLLAVIIEQ